jgi:hypothetical protein
MVMKIWTRENEEFFLAFKKDFDSVEEFAEFLDISENLLKWRKKKKIEEIATPFDNEFKKGKKVSWISREYNVPYQRVRNRKLFLEKRKEECKKRKKDYFISLLGNMNDKDVAKMFNIPYHQVRNERQRRGIISFKEKESLMKNVPWCKYKNLFKDFSDDYIAEYANVPQEIVAEKRRTIEKEYYIQ